MLCQGCQMADLLVCDLNRMHVCCSVHKDSLMACIHLMDCADANQVGSITCVCMNTRVEGACFSALGSFFFRSIRCATSIAAFLRFVALQDMPAKQLSVCCLHNNAQKSIHIANCVCMLMWIWLVAAHSSVNVGIEIHATSAAQKLLKYICPGS